MRPIPRSPASAISPSFGPTSATPSATSCARLRCVALFAHMCGFIAGASRIFALGRQQHRGGEIVGVTARHLGHQVGGGRRHHDQIGFAREPDMADVEFAAGIEQVGEHALADDGAGRQRRDEMLGRLGEDAAHGQAALLQPADEIERLVGGDAAADDQQHALGRRRARWPARRGGSRGGVKRLQRRVAGLLGGGAQNGAHLVLDRAAALGRAQAQAASSIARRAVGR